MTLAVVKMKLQGSLLQREQHLHEDIASYFVQRIGINILTDHFDSRLELDQGQKTPSFAFSTLFVHGVDFLNDREI